MNILVLFKKSKKSVFHFFMKIPSLCDSKLVYDFIVFKKEIKLPFYLRTEVKGHFNKMGKRRFSRRERWSVIC